MVFVASEEGNDGIVETCECQGEMKSLMVVHGVWTWGDLPRLGSEEMTKLEAKLEQYGSRAFSSMNPFQDHHLEETRRQMPRILSTDNGRLGWGTGGRPIHTGWWYLYRKHTHILSEEIYLGLSNPKQEWKQVQGV